MEDALVLVKNGAKVVKNLVLILVLMEDALVLPEINCFDIPVKS